MGLFSNKDRDKIDKLKGLIEHYNKLIKDYSCEFKTEVLYSMEGDANGIAYCIKLLSQSDDPNVQAAKKFLEGYSTNYTKQIAVCWLDYLTKEKEKLEEEYKKINGNG